MLFQGFISRMRISIASEDKRTIGNSGNEPKSTEAVEGVGEKIYANHLPKRTDWRLRLE